MDKTYLRRAAWSDKDIIFEWANEAEVRINSIHTDEIEYQEHLDWFAKKLENRNCDYYIYCMGNKPIGQIRLDYEEDYAWISFSVDKRYRGQGHGGILLKLAEAEVKLHRPETRLLKGVVKKANIASQKKFEQLHYEMTGEIDGNLLLYQKRL